METEKEYNTGEIGWLSGIVDGEGSIGIRRCMKKGKYISYTPFIQVTNCDFILLDRIKEILDYYGIDYTFTIRKDDRELKWRNSGHIAIGNYEGSVRFLKLIMPFLISKKRHAEILLEYCNYRQTIKHREQRIKGKFIKTYDGREIIAYEELHKINHKGLR